MNNSTDFCDILRRPADAIAFVKGKERFSSVDGTVRFYQLRSSVVVRAEIQGLPKGCCCNSPIFAFHIHDGEECSGNILDAFADADGHFNPDNCRHPYHAGDMPPFIRSRRQGCPYLSYRPFFRQGNSRKDSYHPFPAR